MDHMNFSEKLSFSIGRKREYNDTLKFNGQFYKIEHYRKNELIGIYTIQNGVTNAGKDYILNAGFNGGTQVAAGSWVIGFIDNASFTALAAADTMASHTGWIEFTGYSQANRVGWGQGSSSGQTVTNGTPASIDITVSSATLNGIFIASNNTKGGTTGTLWSTGSFTAPVPVSNTDNFKVSYALSC